VNSVPAQPVPDSMPAMWLTTASAITRTPASWHAATIAANWARVPSLDSIWYDTGW